MICGPAAPFGPGMLREMLRERAALLEHGLRVLLEDFDCSRGALAPVDALCRDATGRAVLLLVAEQADAALPARVLHAHSFCSRNREALERALPEAGVDFASFRVLVVGLAIDERTVAALERLGLPELEIHEIEPFRIGGEERIAVRVLRAAAAGAGADVPEPPELREPWSALQRLLERLDPELRVTGDRFSRRATLRGAIVCEFWCADGQLAAVVPGSSPRRLRVEAEVRAFGDKVLRRYLELVEGGDRTAAGAGERSAPEAAGRAPGPAALRTVTIPSLRESLQASRLTREEYSALGGPVAGDDVQESG